MEHMIEKLYNELTSKYYGKYRASVVDRDDPIQKGRLRLSIPAVLGDEESGWAMPCFPNGGISETGVFSVPELEAHVWAEFEAGDISSPIWVGTFFGADDDLPAEAQLTPPDALVLKTPKGTTLCMSDEGGKESFIIQHGEGQSLVMDKSGGITISDTGGESVEFDSSSGALKASDINGNTVEMTGSGLVIKDISGCEINLSKGKVKIKSANEITLKAPMVNLGESGGEPVIEPVIKGRSFITMYMTHTHTTTMGTSGPPIYQGELSTLSSTVKSK